MQLVYVTLERNHLRPSRSQSGSTSHQVWAPTRQHTVHVRHYSGGDHRESAPSQLKDWEIKSRKYIIFNFFDGSFTGNFKFCKVLNAFLLFLGVNTPQLQKSLKANFRWRSSNSNTSSRSRCSTTAWLGPQYLETHKKIFCGQTRRVTIIPRPPLENSQRGESRSSWYIL